MTYPEVFHTNAVAKPTRDFRYFVFRSITVLQGWNVAPVAVWYVLAMYAKWIDLDIIIEMGKFAYY